MPASRAPSSSSAPGVFQLEAPAVELLPADGHAAAAGDGGLLPAVRTTCIPSAAQLISRAGWCWPVRTRWKQRRAPRERYFGEVFDLFNPLGGRGESNGAGHRRPGRRAGLAGARPGRRPCACVRNRCPRTPADPEAGSREGGRRPAGRAPAASRRGRAAPPARRSPAAGPAGTAGGGSESPVVSAGVAVDGGPCPAATGHRPRRDGRSVRPAVQRGRRRSAELPGHGGSRPLARPDRRAGTAAGSGALPVRARPGRGHAWRPTPSRTLPPTTACPGKLMPAPPPCCAGCWPSRPAPAAAWR